MPLIALEQVTRTYQLGATTVRALRGIDLSIDAGEFVALWGPSGSGKSTLCHLMGLVDVPTTGRVQVNGRDAASLSDDLRSEHRNRSVGFIFQQFNLLPVLSAIENVMLPLVIRGEGGAAVRRQAETILGEVGLGDCQHQRPDQLSGGQRQRVAIARALVSAPPVVIADEPTANLDSENAHRIVDLMRTLQSSRGTTFIFATHDQRLMARVSRRIRLQDGVVQEDVRNPDARESVAGEDRNGHGEHRENQRTQSKDAAPKSSVSSSFPVPSVANNPHPSRTTPAVSGPAPEGLRPC